MIAQNNIRKLSRGIDYLGELGAKLRDLAGYSTMACELIQNADDSKSATWIVFDIQDEYLVVDNDGVFSNCGNAEGDICDWKKSDGKMCDFHRFRTVASGNKRNEEGTTGAFGIGFTSVYQITDAPELISNGKHWKVDESADENERIHVCSGCEICLGIDLPGTRFILPWATNPDSILRSRWMVSPVSKNDINNFKNELTQSLPHTLLFLKNLSKISLNIDKQPYKTFNCLRDSKTDSNQIVISDNDGGTQLWQIIQGDFYKNAEELRTKYGNKIEIKRNSTVSIAISNDLKGHGFYCATLPTLESTKLPFHINSDFFTSNDRKRIVSGSDYQSEWNKEAIQAAAETLLHNIERIRSFLSPETIWEILDSIKTMAKEGSKGITDSPFIELWPQFLDQVQELEIVYSSDSKWKKPNQIYLLEKNEEIELTGIYEQLNIAIVHENLRPYFSILRECGVGLLDLPQIINSFTNLGLKDTVVEKKDVPLFIRENIVLIWEEITGLLGRKRKKEDQAVIETGLQAIAIVPTVSNTFASFNRTFKADQEAIHSFGSLGYNINYLDDQENEFYSLREYCENFDVKSAITILEGMGTENLNTLFENKSINVIQIIEWFEARQIELVNDDNLKKRLAALSIFPSSSGIFPLDELAIPGSFDDPIGLTNIIDVQQLGGKRDFLRLIAPQRELTFEKYVLEHLPEAFGNPSITGKQKQDATILLATHLGEIKDNDEIKSVLIDVCLAKTENGIYCLPCAVYIKSKNIFDILADAVDYAAIIESHSEALRELLIWLGASTFPRYRDIVNRIKNIVSLPRTPARDLQVETIFQYLVSHVKDESLFSQIDSLRILQWLPAKNDKTKWYAPGEIYAIYQESIFSTQAKFLSFSVSIQQEASGFMELLGLHKTPDPSLVVNHLLLCSKTNKPVKADVYLFLDQKYNHPAISQLRDRACLYLQDVNKYVRPKDVFWTQHPFGRFRNQLGNDLKRYSNLFGALKVKEYPDAFDACDIILEISNEYGSSNLKLDFDAYAVMMECWRLINSGLDDNKIKVEDLELLKNRKVIPDPRQLLCLPEWMFFEERAGLSLKFEGFLTNNVIPRPQGCWRAMQEVGVRSLEEVVESSLVECEDPILAEEMENLFKNRRLQVWRVIESLEDLITDKSNYEILDLIKFYSTNSLGVVYSLEAFGQTKQSRMEHIDVLYKREDKNLYYVRSDKTNLWASIAKEISLAIAPTSEPGRLAAGLFQVLSAKTDDDASELLDQLGYHTLQAASPTIAGTNTFNAIGAESDTTSEVDPLDNTENISVTPETKMTPEEAIKNIMGGGAPSPTPMPGDPENDNTGSQSGVGKNSKGNGRLLSYVSNSNGHDNGKNGNHSDLNNIGDKGIERVVEYERRQGRSPEVMPPMNEGFDIQSKDADGNIVRYIEVKSLSGEWGTLGAGVSKPQFEFSQRNTSKSWLYVVERATSDDFKIYKIKEPADKVVKFMYDKGWKADSIED